MSHLKSLVTFFFIFIYALQADTPEKLAKIRNLLEGRYELVYWEQDNVEFRYPKVAGTLVVYNNTISFTLDSNMQDNKSTKTIGWGIYTLSEKNYNYKYFDFKRVTNSNKGLIINKELPWKGMREYDVKFKNNILLLTSSTGKQTWKLDKDSLTYRDEEWGTEKKKIQRYWKRIDK